MVRVATFFPALGTGGRQRANTIRSIAAEFGYLYREETNYTVRAGLQAQFCDDVVIYDLSGNDDSNGPYRALVSFYSQCDHVLIISRDYLPANLLPSRSGGAPPYPYPLRDLPNGQRVQFPTKTVRGEPAEKWVEDEDHSMMTWLRRQLADLAAAPAGERLTRAGSDSPLWTALPATQRFAASLKVPSFHVNPSTAFLSYRSADYEAASRLARRTLATGIAGDDVQEVRIVGPAEFALDGELMSAARRWMVFEYLGMLIQYASQLWIFRTQDYLKSWWTLGELVYSVISKDRAQHGRIPRAPYVRILDPISGQLMDKLGDLQIKPRRRELEKIQGITMFTHPGVSSTSLTLQSQRQPPPKGAGPQRTWHSFWNDLLIDRRALDGNVRAYAASPTNLLNGISEMVVVNPVKAAAAVAEGTAVIAEDGSRWQLCELPPRLLFDRPLTTRPDLPVLTRLRTFHTL